MSVPTLYVLSKINYSRKAKLRILKELDQCFTNDMAIKVMAEHNLSEEEVESWRQKFADNGINGLRATRRYA